MTWHFGGKVKQREVVASLRPCSCGKSEYGPLKAYDAVHCSHCGALYLIYGVRDPVARIKIVDDDS